MAALGVPLVPSPPKVLSETDQPCRVILAMPEGEVAGATDQSTDFARRVAMIDNKLFSFVLADKAPPLLGIA
jgi:hypothetical protein